MNEIEFLFCRVMQSQSWLGQVLTRDSTQEPAPNRPPEPGLGYLCLLLVKFEKKVSLSGTAVDRADGPVGWSRQVAGTIFFYLCCVSESSLQMRQRVTCLAAEIRPFRSFFGSKIQPVSAHRPHRVLWFWTQKNVHKKIFAPERTVDQKRADNPGSERAGVPLFSGRSRVSLKLSYSSHNGSRVASTRPGPD